MNRKNYRTSMYERNIFRNNENNLGIELFENFLVI